VRACVYVYVYGHVKTFGLKKDEVSGQFRLLRPQVLYRPASIVKKVKSLRLRRAVFAAKNVKIN
jgi:hypothetical protein